MIWLINFIDLFFIHQKGLLFTQFNLKHLVLVFPMEQVLFQHFYYLMICQCFNFIYLIILMLDLHFFKVHFFANNVDLFNLQFCFKKINLIINYSLQNQCIFTHQEIYFEFFKQPLLQILDQLVENPRHLNYYYLMLFMLFNY